MNSQNKANVLQAKKTSKQKIVVLFLVSICVFLIINPQICFKSVLNAVSVWATKVFPVLFPFFIITRFIVFLIDYSKTTFADRFMKKIYHTPNGSFVVFLLSFLSGYPMGAKLISNLYDDNYINSKDATKMLSFCSISGPMFIIGSVGLAMFNSFKIGIIVLISNVLASLVNGIIFRGEKFDEQNFKIKPKNSTISIAEIVQDSINSILMICAYLILAFLFIDIIKNLFFSNANLSIFHCIIEGFFEITRGLLDLSTLGLNIKLNIVISSGIIGFGGISVMLQSLTFIKKLNIPFKTIFLQKLTQSFLCVVISAILVIFV